TDASRAAIPTASLARSSPFASRRRSRRSRRSSAVSSGPCRSAARRPWSSTRGAQMPRQRSTSTRGQVLVLFTFSIVAMLLLVGLVGDGGYAFSQRRLGQNAADFAAMAGTRIVGEHLTGNPAGAGTGTNVEAAIRSVLAANGAELEAASYVTEGGTA